MSWKINSAAPLAVITLLVLPQVALAECRPVAGTIDATVVGGEPVNVLGNVSGDLAGSTRAVLTGQSEGGEGKVNLTLAHDFVTHGRNSLRTTDSAVWTPIPGQDGVFHMATTYKIEGGTGIYSGATGSLKNDGVADTNTGLVTLRYFGEVCAD
ncbi:MAG: hypothetical protein OEZ19_07635 [Paracoccaceae bacterium]|nr:hypothetical protein [Paracoccaceae bacterium]